MVKEEIVEGLRLAVSKGETLRNAMMSFYNAGYTKQDVEDAARAMQMPQFSQLPQTQPANTSLPTQKIQNPNQQSSQQFQPLSPQNPQKVSTYGSPQTGPSKTAITILVVVLFILIGALIAIFLFKNELTTMLNSLIG